MQVDDAVGIVSENIGLQNPAPKNNDSIHLIFFQQLQTIRGIDAAALDGENDGDIFGELKRAKKSLLLLF